MPRGQQLLRRAGSLPRIDVCDSFLKLVTQIKEALDTSKNSELVEFFDLGAYKHIDRGARGYKPHLASLAKKERILHMLVSITKRHDGNCVLSDLREVMV